MPELDRLIDEGLVTRPTAAVLLGRREPVPESAPVALDEATFAILVALCARLRPRTFRPTARELAQKIDQRLASGKTDGWRYDVLPNDREAYAQGLRSLDAEALARHGTPFAELEGDAADGLIRRAQKGDERTVRFLEDLLAEVVGLAYAQPETQEAIRYDGYADAKGWTHLRLGQKEGWER